MIARQDNENLSKIERVTMDDAFIFGVVVVVVVVDAIASIERGAFSLRRTRPNQLRSSDWRVFLLLASLDLCLAGRPAGNVLRSASLQADWPAGRSAAKAK